MDDKPPKEDELEEFIKAGRTGRRYHRFSYILSFYHAVKVHKLEIF
jgi:hypothetical protein